MLGIVISLVLGMKSNEGKKSPRNGLANRFIPSSFRAISSYIRIVSSGASTVAKSAASVASSFVDRDGDSSHDQVHLQSNWFSSTSSEILDTPSL